MGPWPSPAPSLPRPALPRSVRNTLQDSNVGDKIDAADKEKLEGMVTETLQWLDNNQVRPPAGGCWVLRARGAEGCGCRAAATQRRGAWAPPALEGAGP